MKPPHGDHGEIEMKYFHNYSSNLCHVQKRAEEAMGKVRCVPLSLLMHRQQEATTQSVTQFKWSCWSMKTKNQFQIVHVLASKVSIKWTVPLFGRLVKLCLLEAVPICSNLSLKH